MSAVDRFTVDTEIVNQAIRCETGHACLTDSNHQICSIDHTVSGEVDFVKCNKRRCFYNTRFGDEFICFCPVRHEIHQKYQV